MRFEIRSRILLNIAPKALQTCEISGGSQRFTEFMEST